MHFYGYFRSSASFRVRIALYLKNVPHDFTSIHLRKGDQFQAGYTKLNPQEQVPTIVTDKGDVLVQSPAILEWLEETYPTPPLLPADPIEKARVRALAMVSGCDIHPIDNLRVLTYLQKALQVSEGQFEDWFNHWISLGFRGLEAMLAGHPKTGTFCHGDAPTFADIYLVPQVFNSLRYKLPLAPYPNIKRIFDNCMKLPAFDKAQPKNQPDFEP
ncbi:MAG: maleylacetoacetate isomerase [Rhodospirillaceae bacterium]|nr:maleylacetoacetate isomerase [Rhodospirillaceae bacterium]